MCQNIIYIGMKVVPIHKYFGAKVYTIRGTWTLFGYSNEARIPKAYLPAGPEPQNLSTKSPKPSTPLHPDPTALQNASQNPKPSKP